MLSYSFDKWAIASPCFYTANGDEPLCVVGILSAEKMVRHVQILKHLLDHGGFAYLTGTHHRLDEFSRLFHSFCNFG